MRWGRQDRVSAERRRSGRARYGAVRGSLIMPTSRGATRQARRPPRSASSHTRARADSEDRPDLRPERARPEAYRRLLTNERESRNLKQKTPSFTPGWTPRPTPSGRRGRTATWQAENEARWFAKARLGNQYDRRENVTPSRSARASSRDSRKTSSVLVFDSSAAARVRTTLTPVMLEAAGPDEELDESEASRHHRPVPSARLGER